METLSKYLSTERHKFDSSLPGHDAVQTVQNKRSLWENLVPPY